MAFYFLFNVTFADRYTHTYTQCAKSFQPNAYAPKEMEKMAQYLHKHLNSFVINCMSTSNLMLLVRQANVCVYACTRTHILIVSIQEYIHNTYWSKAKKWNAKNRNLDSQHFCSLLCCRLSSLGYHFPAEPKQRASELKKETPVMKNPIENGTGQNVASEAEERKHAHTLIHPTIIYPQQIRTHRDIQKERGTVHKKAVNAYRHHTVHTKFYKKNYFNHKIHFSLLRSIFFLTIHAFTSRWKRNH